jgi:hypothetical protein
LGKENENIWKKSEHDRTDTFHDGKPCQRQTITFPSGVLLLIRQAQWVSTNSILALIGPEEFSHEGNLIVKIHRIAYRREIFFEDVSLKKTFFLHRDKRIYTKRIFEVYSLLVFY